MDYTIQAIPQDEQGIAFYLASYKPFRLRALRTDPSAFSSIYEREITYDDDKWISRVMNPLATTFVVRPVPPPPPERSNMGIHPDSGAEVPPILSATTVVGPLPPSDALTEHLGRARMQTETETETKITVQVWAINAVWTAPEARRKGIAARLMREAIRHVQEQAQAQTRAGRHSQRPQQAQAQAQAQAQVQGGNASSDPDPDPAAAAAAGTSQGEKEAEAEAAAVAVAELYLDVGVEKHNEAAIALYKKSGFVPYSEECEDVIVQGKGSTRPKEFINMYLRVEYPVLG